MRVVGRRYESVLELIRDTSDPEFVRDFEDFVARDHAAVAMSEAEIEPAKGVDR